MAKPPIARIDELTEPPVIGQRYLVPTVLYPWLGIRKAWPVMGPKHEDGEHIGFHAEHYHVDSRFISNTDGERVARKAGAYHDVRSLPAYYPLSDRGVSEHPSPVWRTRICHRATNDYPVHDHRTVNGLSRLRGAYAGRRCGKNAEGQLICPHKGFPLGSLRPDARGRVVCPLHGLFIDTETGHVLPADALDIAGAA